MSTSQRGLENAFGAANAVAGALFFGSMVYLLREFEWSGDAYVGASQSIRVAVQDPKVWGMGVLCFLSVTWLISFFALALVPNSPLPKTLALLNGPFIPKLLAQPGSQVDAIFLFGGEPHEQLTELFLLLLSRPPRKEELQGFAPLLQGDDSRQAGLDLAHAILLSREFGSIR